MKNNEQIKKASILGLLGNVTLLLVKGICGILFRSQAMIADATNSAGDIFASFMSFIGNKIAIEPADDDHNLGHGKAEYIFSLFIGLAMVFASIIVIINSVKSIINTKYYEFSYWLLIICSITIITKASLYIYIQNIFIKIIKAYY